MKLIIEINEIAYKNATHIPSIDWNGNLLRIVNDALQNGTPIPDNATNGEIMQMMFPNGVTAKFATFMRFVVGEDEYINCAYDWWNAPYQKGE